MKARLVGLITREGELTVTFALEPPKEAAKMIDVTPVETAAAWEEAKD